MEGGDTTAIDNIIAEGGNTSTPDTTGYYGKDELKQLTTSEEDTVIPSHFTYEHVFRWSSAQRSSSCSSF